MCRSPVRQNMDEKEAMGFHIQQRVAELRAEIRDLTAMNEEYRKQSYHSGTERQIHESRRARLMEITAELRELLGGTI